MAAPTSAASATSFSIEPSKAPITREAMKAVTRLTASQVQRLRALAHTGGHRMEAAVWLGWGRNTLTRKIQELGIGGADD